MLRQISSLIVAVLVILASLPTPSVSQGQASYPVITVANFGQLGEVSNLEGSSYIQFDASDPNALYAWYVATGSYVRWDVANAKTSVRGKSLPSNALQQSPNGMYWAASQDDNTLHVLAAEGNLIKTLGGFQQVSNFISFNPTSTMLAATAPTDNIHLWKIDAENTRQIIIPGEAPVRFSADGFLVAFVNPDNMHEVIVKNLPNVMAEQPESTLAVLTTHTAPITDIAFSPDSLTIATASEDGTISLWNPYKGEEKLVLLGHRYPVKRIAFNPTGTLLVSVDDHSVIRGFDVTTGQSLAAFHSSNLAFEGVISELTWNADGSLFAVSGYDNPHIVVIGVGGQALTPPPTTPTTASPSFTAETTAQGITEFDVVGGANAINPIGCLIRAGDTVLALAQAENNALLIMSNSPTCEGAVWVRSAEIVWDNLNEFHALLTLLSQTAPAPLIRISDYTERCAGTLGELTLISTNPNPSVYPPDGMPQSLQATLDTGIDALICHDYVPVRIENCHYLGPGNYSYIFTRYRTDDVIQLIDYDDGTVIASRKFEGLSPPLCPNRTERGEVYGDPPPSEDWSPWVHQIMTSALDLPHLRTTVRIGNLNARELPNTDANVLDRIPVGSPVNLLARDASGEWVAVLLPDMTQGWIFAEYLNIAELIDIETLPVSAASAGNVPISVMP